MNYILNFSKQKSKIMTCACLIFLMNMSFLYASNNILDEDTSPLIIKTANGSFQGNKSLISNKVSPNQKVPSPVPTASSLISEDKENKMVKREIIVKIKKQAMLSMTAGKNVKTLAGDELLQILQKKYRLSHCKALFKNNLYKTRSTSLQKKLALRKNRGPRGSEVPDIDCVYKLRFDESPQKTVDELIKMILEDDAVEWAEPNYRYTTQEVVPNDPSYSRQYHHPAIFNHLSWDYSTGSENCVAAVIETGVDWDHVDLASNIWQNSGEIDGDGIDNDNNGYIDDIRGWDFVTVSAADVYAGEDPGPPDNNPDDFHGHGTHVAGIIGAQGNNGVGVAGVAWDVSIMPCRAGYKDRSGRGALNSDDIVDAIHYAADNGADVINMSFGGSEPSNAIKLALDYAYGQGCVLVAAAGNNNINKPFYPAAFPNVIAVAASNSTNNRAAFSNFGLWVDITAPGNEIFSTTMDNTYDYFSGTSMASPVVAGVAVLMIAANPSWDIDQIYYRLITSGTDLDGNNQPYEGLLGAGLINSEAAVNPSPPARNYVNVVNTHTKESVGDMDDEFEPGEELAMYTTLKNFANDASITAKLRTSDPYVTITQDEADFGLIPFNRSITNINTPFTYSLAAGTPSDYSILLFIDIYVNSILSVTEQVNVKVAPSWRNCQYLAKSTMLHSSAYVTGLCDYCLIPGGGYAATMRLKGPDQEGLFATIIRSDGLINPLTKISDIYNFYNQIDITADYLGNVHIMYAGWVGSYDAEIFYRKYDASSGQWLPEQQLTTNAEIFGPDHPSGPIEIVPDNQNRLHAVWLDYRNGSAQLFYTYYDGSSWQNETAIADITEPIFGLGNVGLIHTPSNDKRTLFYTCNYADDSSGEYVSADYVVEGINYTWTNHHQLDNFYFHKTPFRHEDNVYQVIKRDSYYDQLELVRFDGNLWNFYDILMSQYFSPRLGFVISNYDDYRLVRTEINMNTYGESVIMNTKNDDIWSTSLVPTSQWLCYLKQQLYEDVNGFNHLFMATYHVVGVSRYGNAIARSIDQIGVGYFTDRSIPAEFIPSIPTVVDNGQNTYDQYSLESNWSSSHASGIKLYEVAIGTAPGCNDLVDWQNVEEEQKTFDLTSTPLILEQDYYVSVRARSNGIYESAIGFSDGISYKEYPMDIVLSDQTINSTVDYIALNEIRTGPNLQIIAPADVTFVAGNTIHLCAGTTISFGTKLRAFIDNIIH